MAYVYTAIVGMRFRNLNPSYRSTIDISKIKLSREPSNLHDRFAVKCIFNGVHFGYIEKNKSEQVSKHLANSNGYRIKLLKSGETFYNISITFERIETQISKAKPIHSKKTSKPKTTTTQRDTSVARKKEPVKSTKKKEKPKYQEINNTYKKKPTAQPIQKKSEDTSSSVSVWLFFLILALVYFFS